MNTLKAITLSSLSLSASVFAHGSKDTLPQAGLWNSARPDSHAPISVMADHTHSAGEWMFSYRYMKMHMEDLYDGDSKISNTMMNTGYMGRPLEMDMDMHMFGMMYAPTDTITLMAMTNYVKNSMDMVMGPMNTPMEMESEGWGDTSIGGLYKFYDADNKRAHLGLSLSLPTGSTDETTEMTMMGMNGMPMTMTHHQPFPMQLGTGTFDLLPSITYLDQPNDFWSWGAQLKGRIHLGDNDEGYSFGDSISATSWTAANVTNWASLSFRLAATSWSSIDGDTNNSLNMPMMPNMSSPADPDNHGGTRIDAGIGLNLWHPTSGFRVATEFIMPVYQKLNGPQLGQDWTLTLGTQYAW
ncbi:transporter [Rubritalea spongiae]|uniref:Transporter n=1 Tax=Rubritalea spongiae TaxID=430797 RepID=A0ABW5E8K7_9BACT